MQSSSTANPPQAHVAHIEDTPIETHRQAHPVRAAAIGSAALLIALLAVLFGYGAAHEGRVFRGVSALGKDLGGMSSVEARAALSTAAAGYPSGSVTVAGGGRTWTFSPADLGWAVDLDRTAQAAMSVGRDGGLRRYSYPEFRLLGRHRLGLAGYLVAVDGKAGRLYVAGFDPKSVTERPRDRGHGDIHVYDLKELGARPAPAPGAAGPGY